MVLCKINRSKHWLEFHIFLCTVGPLLVLYHTAFKFGGIVSVSFWSMVLVVLSGVAGKDSTEINKNEHKIKIVFLIIYLQFIVINYITT